VTDTLERKYALKHMAIQIAAQLPQGEREALAVLAYARELVTGFLSETEPEPKGDVVTLDRRR